MDDRESLEQCSWAHCARVARVVRDPHAARARGVVRAQVVARDHRVAPDVLQPAAPQLALRVHRRVVLGVVHALREQALVQALGGLARRHASVRLRRAR